VSCAGWRASHGTRCRLLAFAGEQRLQDLVVLRQRNDHLRLTGMPWRMFLSSDLDRDDFPLDRM
jgi:hypothetical protein